MRVSTETQTNTTAPFDASRVLEHQQMPAAESAAAQSLVAQAANPADLRDHLKRELTALQFSANKLIWNGRPYHDKAPVGPQTESFLATLDEMRKQPLLKIATQAQRLRVAIKMLDDKVSAQHRRWDLQSEAQQRAEYEAAERREFEREEAAEADRRFEAWRQLRGSASRRAAR